MQKNLIALLLLLLVTVASCGDNQFASMEKKDPAEDAAIQLENDNPEKAIEILEEALEDDPENYQLISLLSMAYAQKAGVTIIDLALAMAEGDDNEEASSDIAILWPFLPDPTDAILEEVAYSVTLLNSIPSADRTKADNFKLALLSTASVSLRTKSFDLNKDGKLSTQEILAMSAGDAAAIISGILGASSAILQGVSGGDNSEKAADQITGIADDLAEAEGDTDEERLANYFANQQGQ